MWKTPGLAIWEHDQAHWYGLHVLICAGGGSAARAPARGYVAFPGGPCPAVAHSKPGAGLEVPAKKSY